MAASKQASIFSRESGRITYLERENSAKVGLAVLAMAGGAIVNLVQGNIDFDEPRELVVGLAVLVAMVIVVGVLAYVWSEILPKGIFPVTWMSREAVTDGVHQREVRFGSRIVAERLRHLEHARAPMMAQSRAVFATPAAGLRIRGTERHVWRLALCALGLAIVPVIVWLSPGMGSAHYAVVLAVAAGVGLVWSFAGLLRHGRDLASPAGPTPRPATSHARGSLLRLFDADSVTLSTMVIGAGLTGAFCIPMLRAWERDDTFAREPWLALSLGVLASAMALCFRRRMGMSVPGCVLIGVAYAIGSVASWSALAAWVAPSRYDITYVVWYEFSFAAGLVAAAVMVTLQGRLRVRRLIVFFAALAVVEGGRYAALHFERSVWVLPFALLVPAVPLAILLASMDHRRSVLRDAVAIGMSAGGSLAVAFGLQYFFEPISPLFDGELGRPVALLALQHTLLWPTLRIARPHWWHRLPDHRVLTRRMRGTVKWFNEAKGYGFITAEGQAGDVFVHSTRIERAGQGPLTLVEGEHVEFDTEWTAKGPLAVNVRQLP
jgi:CspA family cold shock protein